MNLENMTTHELLIEAQKQESNFQEIARELTKMKHSRFIDETQNIEDRNFSIMILLKEDDFWDNNPDYNGCYEDTEEYGILWKKAYEDRS